MQKENNVITNPIRSGFFPDPSIVQVGKDYYMVNSSFLYFPCIPISHSTDLVNWEIIGHAITEKSYIDFTGYEQGRGLWAPDISYYNDKYYIIVTLRGNDDSDKTHRQMVVWSDKPEGPYSKPEYIDIKGIDPSIFHDDDGKNYMLLNTQVKIVPLSDDCLKAIGPETVIHEGWSKVKTEGPHILKKDNFYYLIMAEGGTGDGHMITVARSESLYGPYENCPYNPLLTQNDLKGYLQRTGHGKFFTGPDGEWYVVHLCGRKNGGRYSLLGRETALQKVTWTSDGWPLINNGEGPKTFIEVSYPVTAKDILPYTINFNYTDNFPIDLIHYNNYVFTRQTAIDCNVKLTFTNLLPSSKSYGLIFYYDMFSYIKYGIEVNDDRYTLFIDIMNIDINKTEKRIFESDLHEIDSSVYLEVETKSLQKEFFLIIKGERTIIKHLANCSFLTDEGISFGKRFTGPVIGVFGHENNKALSQFIMINH